VKNHSNKGVPKGRTVKTRGELDLDDLPPIEDLHITVKQEQCEPIGKVYTIVDRLG
jgi:H/ACA ribonucleoprotein complex non-core subunit NAF1